MKVAIIGRTSILYNCAKILLDNHYEIPLIITSKEAPEYTINSNDFKKLAEDIGAKFIYTPKINEEEIITNILSLGEIDLAVSINYSGVISQKVINLFRFGVLNAHGGDLPKYRGNACQAWALINGEKKIGLCIHKMIGGELDSGPIISREYFNVDINTRIGQVYDWIESETPKLVLQSVNEIKKNNDFVLEYQSLNPSDSLRCYPRNPSDGKIDWGKSNEDILRLINASSEPFSGAFTSLNEQQVIIWRAEIYENDENYLAVSGQISTINKTDGSIIVICGLSKLRITEIEIDGQRGLPETMISSIRKRLI